MDLIILFATTAVPTYAYAAYVAWKYRNRMLLVDSRLLGLLAVAGLSSSLLITTQAPPRVLVLSALFTKAVVLLISITAKPLEVKTPKKIARTDDGIRLTLPKKDNL